MDYIKYETTLKASGREYSKIVFWNRFIRNPIELILTWLPAAITIVCIALGCFSSYLAVIYAACWCYPIYIFGFQFKSSASSVRPYRHTQTTGCWWQLHFYCWLSASR